MNSGQLQLDLWEAEISRLPWRGQRPRGLTTAAKLVIFKAQAVKSERELELAGQLVLGLTAKRAPWVYRGAPLLKGG